MNQTDYVIRVLDAPQQIDARAWNRLLAQQALPCPFLRHEYLSALHETGCASPAAGWHAHFFTLWRNGQLQAACPLYLKDHSRGEYVFDWAWAEAYQRHRLAYYPKALVAVPFTPVSGSRLLAVDASARRALLRVLLDWCASAGLSSLHLLFLDPAEVSACAAAGLSLRCDVQFHWHNQAGTQYRDFDDFLAHLTQEKRKKIRQERRKVAAAGVSFRWARGADISSADWDFFYRCYARTYREHGNAPYLSRAFFARLADTQPDHWLLFTAERAGRSIATSLIALGEAGTSATVDFDNNSKDFPVRVGYGRYWGALERVDCLHFEACYYQPLQWCIAHGVHRFEGGAQGEHKMSRALLPVTTHSAHWLSHPGFAEAVEDYLQRERLGVAAYLDELALRNPLKSENASDVRCDASTP